MPPIYAGESPDDPLDDSDKESTMEMLPLALAGWEAIIGTSQTRAAAPEGFEALMGQAALGQVLVAPPAGGAPQEAMSLGPNAPAEELDRAEPQMDETAACCSLVWPIPFAQMAVLAPSVSTPPAAISPLTADAIPAVSAPTYGLAASLPPQAADARPSDSANPALFADSPEAQPAASGTHPAPVMARTAGAETALAQPTANLLVDPANTGADQPAESDKTSTSTSVRQDAAAPEANAAPARENTVKAAPAAAAASPEAKPEPALLAPAAPAPAPAAAAFVQAAPQGKSQPQTSAAPEARLQPASAATPTFSPRPGPAAAAKPVRIHPEMGLKVEGGHVRLGSPLPELLADPAQLWRPLTTVLTSAPEEAAPTFAPPVAANPALQAHLAASMAPKAAPTFSAPKDASASTDDADAEPADGETTEDGIGAALVQSEAPEAAPSVEGRAKLSAPAHSAAAFLQEPAKPAAGPISEPAQTEPATTEEAQTPVAAAKTQAQSEQPAPARQDGQVQPQSKTQLTAEPEVETAPSPKKLASAELEVIASPDAATQSPAAPIARQAAAPADLTQPAPRAEVSASPARTQAADALDRMLATGRSGRTTIRLNPDQLGEITITVVTRRRRVEAEITASSSEVRTELASHSAELAKSMEAKGHSLAALVISGERQPADKAAAPAPAPQNNMFDSAQQQSGGQESGNRQAREEAVRQARLTALHNDFGVKEGAPHSRIPRPRSAAGLDTIA